MSESSMAKAAGRAYRSHSQPACLACRRRKSRCVIDGDTDNKCSLCIIHETECLFPSKGVETAEVEDKSDPKSKSAGEQRPSRKRKRHDETSAASLPGRSSSAPQEILNHGTRHKSSQAQNPFAQPVGISKTFEDSPAALRLLGETDHESSHIVGPLLANDAEVLQNYFSVLPQSNNPGQTVRPTPYSMFSKGPGGPVLYMTVQRQPAGLVKGNSPGFDQYRVVEKLVEPFAEDLLDLYFAESNICFPLLDEATFRKQYAEDKKSIQPSVLAWLYVGGLIYWRNSPKLAIHYCPDERFACLQAGEALRSELLLSPGISTIVGALLDIGGRPTTSMTRNAIVMGSVVALAHSFGLNRNPNGWPLPDSEKALRVRLWWATIIHDRWCSFGYGTPPLINQAHCDVPLPTVEQLSSNSSSSEVVKATEVFVALCGLSDVLGACLEFLHELGKDMKEQASLEQSFHNLEVKLDAWEERLPERVRIAVIRGIQVQGHGMANLRLAYLGIMIMLHRLDMETVKRTIPIQATVISHKRTMAQRAAEDIIFFVQELQKEQLRGFWIPTVGFCLATAATFLVRCALEDNAPTGDVSQSRPLKLVGDLLNALRSHRDKHGWDLGDVCLAQCSGIFERLQQVSLDALSVAPTSDQLFPFEMSLPDDLFPNLWEVFDSEPLI